MSDIFYEPQRGGLCRLHAINAFFGYSKISVSEWQDECKTYDDTTKKSKAYVGMSCKAFDFSYFGNNIVSSIMGDYGIYLRYVPIGTQEKVSLDNLIGDFVFAFNAGHIYGYRRKQGRWYKVDSLSGISRANANFVNDKRQGKMIPCDFKKEFYRNVALIQGDLSMANCVDIDTITDYIKSMHIRKKDLGNLYVWVQELVNILKTCMRCKDDDAAFSKIKNVIYAFEDFTAEFESNYLSLDAKIRTFAPILFWVRQLGLKK